MTIVFCIIVLIWCGVVLSYIRVVRGYSKTLKQFSDDLQNVVKETKIYYENLTKRIVEYDITKGKI